MPLLPQPPPLPWRCSLTPSTLQRFRATGHSCQRAQADTATCTLSNEL